MRSKVLAVRDVNVWHRGGQRNLRWDLECRVRAAIWALLALCSCTNNAPASALSITVTNRRPEPQKVELILQSTEPEKELHKVKGEVAANYSEQFTVPRPTENLGTMKLIVQTADGKGTTILLDESRWKKPFRVTLNRERKIEVSED